MTSRTRRVTPSAPATWSSTRTPRRRPAAQGDAGRGATSRPPRRLPPTWSTTSTSRSSRPPAPSTGATSSPEAGRPPAGAADALNNVENVFLKTPAAGSWTVRIIGTNVPMGPQGFGLVVDNNPGSQDKCDGVVATIIGRSTGETFLGTGGRDVILAGSGADTVVGTNGNDVVCGGNGNDTLNGATGNDDMFGEGGADVVNAGVGADLLEGGVRVPTISTVRTAPTTSSATPVVTTSTGAGGATSATAAPGSTPGPPARAPSASLRASRAVPGAAVSWAGPPGSTGRSVTPLDTAAVARATAGEPAWRAEARRGRPTEGRGPGAAVEQGRAVEVRRPRLRSRRLPPGGRARPGARSW